VTRNARNSLDLEDLGGRNLVPLVHRLRGDLERAGQGGQATSLFNRRFKSHSGRHGSTHITAKKIFQGGLDRRICWVHICIQGWLELKGSLPRMERQMAKSYQVVQERYEPGYDQPTRDEYPFLFGSV